MYLERPDFPGSEPDEGSLGPVPVPETRGRLHDSVPASDEGAGKDELAALPFIAREYPDSAFEQFDLAAALERYDYFEEAREHCARALDLKPGFEAAIEMRERPGPG